MAATGQDTATTLDSLGIDRDGDRAPPGTPDPFAEFRVAAGLYALWAAIAFLSILAGRTLLPQQAAGVLTVGIVATNALFLMIARSDPQQRPPAATLTLSQSVLGITWTTLFAFMSAGSDELVLAMYVSAMLFAIPRISIAAASQLTAFATVSFGIVVLFKALLTGSQPPLWPEFISVISFAGVMASVLLYRRYLDAAAQPLTPDADANPATRDATSRYGAIVDVLKREKGRTDRTNYPFSVCLFDADGFARLMRDCDPDTTQRVRERISKRMRGELRAMDGIKPVGIRRSLDRLNCGRFMIVLPTTNHAGATRCAERIRAAISRYPIEGQFAMTLSGGVVEYRRGETVAMLLDRAEAALARAEAAGGDLIVGYNVGEERCADVVPLRN